MKKLNYIGLDVHKKNIVMEESYALMAANILYICGYGINKNIDIISIFISNHVK